VPTVRHAHKKHINTMTACSLRGLCVFWYRAHALLSRSRQCRRRRSACMAHCQAQTKPTFPRRRSACMAHCWHKQSLHSRVGEVRAWRIAWHKQSHHSGVGEVRAWRIAWHKQSHHSTPYP